MLFRSSFVDKQAYQEVIEDGHPILIISASDIAYILRSNSITSENISEWLVSIDETDSNRMAKRVQTYSKLINRKR